MINEWTNNFLTNYVEMKKAFIGIAPPAIYIESILDTKLSNLKEINDLISELGGFDYSKNKLQEFSDKAITAIDGYDDSETKNSLIKLVEFNVSRLK